MCFIYINICNIKTNIYYSEVEAFIQGVDQTKLTLGMKGPIELVFKRTGEYEGICDGKQPSVIYNMYVLHTRRSVFDLRRNTNTSSKEQLPCYH